MPDNSSQYIRLVLAFFPSKSNAPEEQVGFEETKF